MEQYIPKSAVVAEIERRILILQKNPYENHKTICHLDSLKQSCNNLEVKEVDIKTELGKYFGACYHNKDYNIAKHFFELGLNASNPLTWEDIAQINSITNTLLNECKDEILYDTEEEFSKEVLKRFIEQKGEKK